jgi:nicotinate-nucleotide adenylyltransferase
VNLSGAVSGSPSCVMRVGLYGGAFDPPHVAHQALVQAFIEQAQLDVLHVCPTAGAWHKSRHLTASAHRLRMAELAFAQWPQVLVDPREIDRGGNTYTVDTLEQLRAQYPGAQLQLLIGQDQYEAISTWRAVPRIEQLAAVFVASRIVQSRPEAPLLDASALPSGYRALVWSPIAISATHIRERCQKQQSIDGLVTPAVARYMDEHHLYQSHP